MIDPVLGLVGMLVLAAGLALGVRWLAVRLRRRLAEEAPEDPLALAPDPAPPSASTARYFFLAVVGFVLHAGSFYFYLWGASARSVGLAGLMVMLGVGMCLIVGVFYSWARGAVSYATPPDRDIPAD